MKILIVDDNTHVRRGLQRLLRAHELRCAADAESALEILAGSWIPDLVLTDALGIGMAPASFVVQIRGLVRCPVILISGSVELPGVPRIPKSDVVELMAAIERVERGEPPCPPES